jgi:hypothetical protein
MENDPEFWKAQAYYWRLMYESVHTHAQNREKVRVLQTFQDRANELSYAEWDKLDTHTNDWPEKVDYVCDTLMKT